MPGQLDLDKDFLCSVHNPEGLLESFLVRLREAIESRGHFSLCLGSTETSDLDWISAAGADAAARRMTPAIDAEALVLGHPLSAKKIPVSPKGIVSPVVLSRAMLKMLDCDVEIFDCGSFFKPQVEHIGLNGSAAACAVGGHAMRFEEVERLFELGREHGRELAKHHSYLAIAECVPGGTTNALGVLTALGFSAAKMMSSSVLKDTSAQKLAVVEEGLKLAGSTDYKAKPLRAVAAVGDPMQPFVAGMALEASKMVPVILAGGTQMLAVYALAAAISDLSDRSIAVLTTKWVAFDQTADVGALAKLVDAPFAAACPDFNCSRHEGLTAYEQGNVKEGVGAGGLMALASLAGYSHKLICEAIDDCYEEMVLSN